MKTSKEYRAARRAAKKQEKQLIEIMSTEIQKEIDKNIVDDIIRTMDAELTKKLKTAIDNGEELTDELLEHAASKL